jgi:hypothetical protein
MDKPRPEYDPLLVLKIFKDPTILDQENFLHAVKEKPFRKDYIFRKFFKRFFGALQCFWDVLIGQNHVGKLLQFV